MAQFKFRLQSLFDVAQQKERNIQQELARALAAETEARARLERAMGLWKEWETEIRRRQQGLLDPHVMRDLLRSVELIRQRASRESDAVRAAGRAVEEVRGRLAEAAKARKSLERLRERQHEQHMVEHAALQTKLLDDLAAVRASARQNSTNAVITGVSA